MKQIVIKRHTDSAGCDNPCTDLHGNVQKESVDIAFTQPCRLKGIKKYSLLDDIVLYFPKREMMFSLNSSAKAIWKLCDG